MDAQELLAELRSIRDCVFATVDAAGAPEARVIDVMLVEDSLLIFCTARGKEFYRQLVEDGRVAVTGMNDRWQTVRLKGVARRLDDQHAWIDRIFEANPSMNDVYPGDARYILEAFCIEAGELEFFDLGVAPIEREATGFGGSTAKPKGFLITDGCMECGTCVPLCPQRCIEEGSPYLINARNCLHCGRCYENCPFGAIERL